jgi:UDP-N-acetylmuramyl pentapeptide phosphotransferase/UDP-N-acetylglucosamine-1-phosphate transferase
MASTVRSDTGGSVIGFAIVFVSFVFRSFIPAPTWVWLVILAVGVLLAIHLLDDAQERLERPLRRFQTQKPLTA